MTATSAAGQPRPRRSIGDLLAVSFLMLFLELVLIRWVSACVYIIAYFSNLILIGCFLGFGLGCMTGRRRDYFAWGTAILALILAVGHRYEGMAISTPFETDFMFSAGRSFAGFFVVVGLFALIALLFTVIGQRLAVLLDDFPPLEGYSINIAGSLLGTLAFTCMSFLWLSPTLWFVAVFALFLWLLRREHKALALTLMMGILSLAMVHTQQKKSLWSPYYKIQLQQVAPGGSGSFRLDVNNDIHQYALNLSHEWRRRDGDLAGWGKIYDFPYTILGHKPARVLVLGAGTGNDVAAALRSGAEHVDAVELDPLIYKLGKWLHPEHPYDDPRVAIHIEDARHFLRGKPLPYDAVILGWLDSHRLFSSLSNVRQDNFVYTIEAMRSIRALLKPDGQLTLSFYVARPWIAKKIDQMLTVSFGHPPLVFNYPGGGYLAEGHQFVIRPAPWTAPLPHVAGFQNLGAYYAALGPAPMPTDDWPFLYYKERHISPEYGGVLLALLLLSAAAVFGVLRGSRAPTASLWPFFFLGAGFMLLEAKNITLLALTYGSTWLVTSIVVAAVLLMILISSWLVEKKLDPRPIMTWVLLSLSLLAAYFWQTESGALAPAAQAVMTTLVLSSTFLFANILFCRLFAATTHPSQALGFNVLGAVLGGLAEYLTLVVGIRAIYLLALAVYGTAWTLSNRGVAGRKAAVTAP